MRLLMLLYPITAFMYGTAAASARVVAAPIVWKPPASLPLMALGITAVLQRAGAMGPELTRLREGLREGPAAAASPDKPERGLQEFTEFYRNRKADSSEKDAGLPGIAGAPPPQSGVAQMLPSGAPLRLHGLPGWCKETGREPRTSSLRARGFAKLARRTFYEEEVLSHPTDPMEWGCTHPWSAWLLYAIVIWAVGTMIAFLMVSFFYRGSVPKYDERSAANPEETFLSGHFGCLSDRSTCLMAFFCPAIRWADTVHMAGVLSFWFAFWILSACYLPSIAFVLIWGLFPLVPLLVARQRLRDKLGLPSGNETWVSDCCFAFWCSCCLIAQEARVVNESYAIGHTAMPLSGGRMD